MDLQTIMKDKYSMAVIMDLSNGEVGADNIAKKNHLPAVGIDKAVNHLMAEGVIGGPRTKLHLTDKGKEMLKEMRGLEHIPSGVADARARSRAPDRLGPEDNRRRKENQGT